MTLGNSLFVLNVKLLHHHDWSVLGT